MNVGKKHTVGKLLLPPIILSLFLLLQLVAGGGAWGAEAEKKYDVLFEHGRLEVLSSPPGAKVFLDGREQLEVTPMGLAEVPLGTHQVRLHLDRYYDATQSVVIAADTVSKLDFELKGGDLVRCGEIWLEPEAGRRCLAETEARRQAVMIGEFVTVPGGCFQMGDNFGGGVMDEKPLHEVCLDSFAIGKFEVTQGQWQAVMGKNPAYFKKGDTFPVEQVSWAEAQNFISRLNELTGKNFRMPSEAEWEYAARSGGKNELYAGGDKLADLAWYDGNSGRTTHAVGTKQPNGLGIYDMSGNVAEWVQDWYGGDYYSHSSKNNPVGQLGGFGRVYRGGGWNNGPGMERTAKRDRYEPRNFFAAIGFRLAYSLK